MIKSAKKYIRFQKELRQLRRALRKNTQPQPEFFRAARKNFLAKLEKKKFTAGQRPVIKMSHSWRFALVAVLLAFMFGGGVMAMANEPGVGPGHPLYSIKRAGENIQLALASNRQKPLVHYQLAKNRLAEIKMLNDRINQAQVVNEENQNPAKGEVSSVDSEDKNQEELGELNQEFDAQIDATLKKIDQIDDKANDQTANLSDAAQKKEKDLCESIAETIRERNSVLSNFDINYAKDFSTWQKYCGRYVNVSSGRDGASPTCH